MMKLPPTPAGPAAAPPPRWQVYAAEAAPGQAPAGPRHPLAFASLLYFEPAYQALPPAGRPVLSFYLEDEARQLTVAQLFVALDSLAPGQAASPAQAAPFGGVQLAPGLPATALHQLLDAAEATLRQRGQHALQLRAYADCYDPAGATTQAAVLRQRQYAVAQHEATTYLDLTRAYEAHLPPAARRRLARGRRAGLVVEQEPPLLLPAAYELLAACRTERQQPPLPLPLEDLQALFRQFPRRYTLLSVREGGTGAWAAVAVAAQVSERVLRSGYLGSPRAFGHLGAAGLLVGGLHQLGRSLGQQVLDLGHLPRGGFQPQPSPEPARRFQHRLGFLRSPALTWRKAL